MDISFAQHLRLLDQASLAKLSIRRVARGSYEIDGRRVNLSWRTSDQGLPPHLVACDSEVSDAGAAEATLRAYLAHAAHVVASSTRARLVKTSGRGSDKAVAQILEEPRLSFQDSPTPYSIPEQLAMMTDSDRRESMRVAVEQARLREEAVMEAMQIKAVGPEVRL